METYYIDGKFVAASQAVIPVNDLAVLRGFGVFELIRTYNGKPFCLEAHLNRLLHSAAQIGLEISWSTAQIMALVMETLRRNALAECNIRIVVTGGHSSDFMTPEGKSRLMIMVAPLPIQPSWWYADGVKIITITSERHLPGAKSINYIPATMALKQARARGAAEAVFVDRRGFVLEGTMSNLFIFQNGVLITPGEGILAGITRQVILDLADSVFAVEIRPISLVEFEKADEVFITGTNKGLVPVAMINDTPVQAGCPGVHTRQMLDIFYSFVAAQTDYVKAPETEKRNLDG